MKLKDFLKKNNLTHKEFADIVKLAQSTITNYIAGRRQPNDDETFQRIFIATKGTVTPNDFYNINPNIPKDNDEL